MPLYEYVCVDPKCETAVELLRPFAESDNCPKCEKCEAETRRKISKTSFSLKGGGWANTGYS